MQETVIVNKTIEPTPAGIQQWCQDYVADLLGTQPDKINPNTEFDRFGLDSAMAVAMCLDLEEQIGIDIPPALLFEYTTIAELAGYVATAVGQQRGAA
ncbi:MAG TPA: acyl carrier protein [Bradyrhizobium sp.]|nr:acyl carrier protein [Bradyrhizobium sp.]